MGGGGWGGEWLREGMLMGDSGEGAEKGVIADSVERGGVWRG